MDRAYLGKNCAYSENDLIVNKDFILNDDSELSAYELHVRQWEEDVKSE